MRKARYRVKDRSYHFERGYRLGKLRGYSEGLEKGMSFYNETAAKIRELISEGGGSHDSSRND